jgi:dolichol-phosphate mannosyltransferase
MSGPVRIVIPAYNEAANLKGLCERIRIALDGRPYKLFIVDDGSRDGTGDVLRELGKTHPIEALTHEVNCGIAAVFLTGLRAATADAGDDDAVVVMEGDGTSAPEILGAMLEKLSGDCDVVIASRYQAGGSYKDFPAKRLFLSCAANTLLGLVCRVPGVQDYTIFYRAYRAGPLKKALKEFGDRFTSTGGFACNAEMLLRLRGYIREVGEVPLVYDYSIKKGASSMNLKKNLKSYLELFRIYFKEGR